MARRRPAARGRTANTARKPKRRQATPPKASRKKARRPAPAPRRKKALVAKRAGKAKSTPVRAARAPGASRSKKAAKSAPRAHRARNVLRRTPGVEVPLVPAKSPRLDRVRRTLDEMVQTPPSSLDIEVDIEHADFSGDKTPGGENDEGS